VSSAARRHEVEPHARQVERVVEKELSSAEHYLLAQSIGGNGSNPT